MGALHGTAWIPKSWLDNLENSNNPGFFDQAAVDAALTADSNSESEAVAAASQERNEQGEQQHKLVHTTRDMGRDGATLLARLLAKLDCK